MKPTGYIVYRGPSELNGEPIVVVAIIQSGNTKTGNVVQTYILADTDVRPTEAMRTGLDAAACGDCKHRFVNAATCYVVVRQGPTMVWKSLQAGRYPDVSRDAPLYVAALMKDRMLRIGTYGDPAAAPLKLWRNLIMQARGWVGYTHQWQRPDKLGFSSVCMASVDSIEEQERARRLGWRTFRVRTHDEPVVTGEGICPASDEGGHKLQCTECRACSGWLGGPRGNIAIIVHGNHPKHREARLLKAREAA